MHLKDKNLHATNHVKTKPAYHPWQRIEIIFCPLPSKKKKKNIRILYVWYASKSDLS